MDNTRGEVMVLVKSERLAGLAARYSEGLKDSEVRERTQLKQSTWQRIQWGDLSVGKDKLIQFAVGLNVPIEEVIAASAEKELTHDELVERALAGVFNLAGLKGARHVKATEYVLKLLADEQASHERNAA